MDLWVTEKIQKNLKMSYKVKKTLFSEVSKFQKVDVVETEAFGKMLLNDGLVMTTERDEFIYHEMICHVPLLLHPKPKNVLIIGGGDGGTAREVLKYPDVKVTMVEIDEAVVRACKEYIHVTSYELENKRLNLIIDDGVKFLKDTNEVFDVILVDSTDPMGPSTPLFGVEFYKSVYSKLSADGIVISQAENPHYFEEVQKSVLLNLNEAGFSKVSLYNYSNLTYPGGLWSFSYGSKSVSSDSNLHESRLSSEQWKALKYFTPEIARAAFALPAFQKNKVQEFLKL